MKVDNPGHKRIYYTYIIDVLLHNTIFYDIFYLNITKKLIIVKLMYVRAVYIHFIAKN